MAHIYFLQSQDGRHQYLGSTTDTNVRLDEHNRGVTSSTRHKGPWRLIATWDCTTITEARQIEYEIKRMKRKLTVEQINFIIKKYKENKKTG